MIVRRRAAVVLLLALAAVGIAACGGGNNVSPQTATVPPTAAVSTPPPATTVVATGTVSTQIRSLDLRKTAPVQQLLTATGGQFVASQVIYADLTGNGVEDAVVPISSGGTLGDIAYVVLAPGPNGVVALPMQKGVTSSGGIAVKVVGGKLVDIRPEYGPNDPNCCPSMLRETTYAWNGKELAVVSTLTVPNPNGGLKRTPGASVSPAAPNSAPNAP